MLNTFTLPSLPSATQGPPVKSFGYLACIILFMVKVDIHPALDQFNSAFCPAGDINPMNYFFPLMGDYLDKPPHSPSFLARSDSILISPSRSAFLVQALSPVVPFSLPSTSEPSPRPR